VSVEPAWKGGSPTEPVSEAGMRMGAEKTSSRKEKTTKIFYPERREGWGVIAGSKGKEPDCFISRWGEKGSFSVVTKQGPILR